MSKAKLACRESTCGIVVCIVIVSLDLCDFKEHIVMISKIGDSSCLMEE